MSMITTPSRRGPGDLSPAEQRVARDASIEVPNRLRGELEEDDDDLYGDDDITVFDDDDLGVGGEEDEDDLGDEDEGDSELED